mmetsp:Transcript_2195/g.6401  ORF Transcript_2195/g.6401 Transcript_2195/m.6401 type:complete len:142 (-) Transcript_2195:614-1039(-)
MRELLRARSSMRMPRKATRLSRPDARTCTVGAVSEKKLFRACPNGGNVRSSFETVHQIRHRRRHHEQGILRAVGEQPYEHPNGLEYFSLTAPGKNGTGTYSRIFSQNRENLTAEAAFPMFKCNNDVDCRGGGIGFRMCSLL